MPSSSLRGAGVLATFIGLSLFLAGSGATWQWARTLGDQRRFPPPGALVDVGGFRLHLLCQGTGTPTVVMDAGLGDSYLTWQSIQPAVAQSTRVCSYDRAGLGYSDPGPEPRDSRRIVAELHALLRQARLPPPYVLVGHSFGGFNTRLFAYTWPDEVAALVLVDVSHEDQWRLFPATARSGLERYTRELCRQSRLAWLGIERLRGETAADTMAAPRALRAMATTLGYRTAWYRAECRELLAFASVSAEQVRSARRTLAVPVYILDGNARFSQEMQADGVPRPTPTRRPRSGMPCIANSWRSRRRHSSSWPRPAATTSSSISLTWFCGRSRRPLRRHAARRGPDRKTADRRG